MKQVILYFTLLITEETGLSEKATICSQNATPAVYAV